MTNLEYFRTYCVKQDLCAIYRYAMWELKLKFENKPLGKRPRSLKNGSISRWMQKSGTMPEAA